MCGDARNQTVAATCKASARHIPGPPFPPESFQWDSISDRREIDNMTIMIIMWRAPDFAGMRSQLASQFE
jgi:hypothetical protein